MTKGLALQNKDDSAEALPPLVISPVASSLEKCHHPFLRNNIYNILREKWACNASNHKFCLRGEYSVDHIPLSDRQISIWVEDIFRGLVSGSNALEAPTVSTSFECNEDEPTEWGETDASSSDDIAIGPGYFCGLALKRTGKKLLHGSKVFRIMCKLALYKRKQRLWSGPHRPSTQAVGIMIQETADLMRPCYPLYIRQRANELLRNAWACVFLPPVGPLKPDADKCYQLSLLTCLGDAFNFFGDPRYCAGSTEIASALYKSLTSAPLHIDYSQITSTFIVILTSLNGLSDQDYSLLSVVITRIVENFRHLPCSQQDARFKILTEGQLDIFFGLTGTTPLLRHYQIYDRLFLGELAMSSYFMDRVMLVNYTRKVDRIASFFFFYLRHVKYMSVTTNLLITFFF
ncbi:hypothetical protein BU17DRAFT_60391 [Hysterangium stoloniferum]|nr:hypothetical protein BU17DRAFT_60391 [Hysterangium stoloniferum]